MFNDQFEIFPVVVQTKSFSKAAKLLHLSQPAISGKIQAMEDYYGIKLFNRTAKGVTLTEAGKIVWNYASRFTDLHKAMENELECLQNIDNQQLALGASCTSGNYAMPCCIRAFKEKYPRANVKLDIANSAQTLKKLNDKEIEVAIIDGKVDSTDYIVTRLDSIKFVFVAANHEDRKWKKTIGFRELKAKPFIIREKGAVMRSVLEELAIGNGCNINDFNVVSEMNSIHSIKAAVERGIGLSLVPLIAVQRELADGTLRIIRIEELDLKIDVNLVYSANEEPSVIAQRFIKFLNHPLKSGFCWNEKTECA